MIQPAECWWILLFRFPADKRFPTSGRKRHKINIRYYLTEYWIGTGTRLRLRARRNWIVLRIKSGSVICYWDLLQGFVDIVYSSFDFQSSLIYFPIYYKRTNSFMGFLQWVSPLVHFQPWVSSPSFHKEGKWWSWRMI